MNNDLILQRLEQVKKIVAGRAQIMIVTKGQDISRIEPLLQAGHRLFGENRVQEAAQKWPALRLKYPDLQLHLIGPLQTNKVRQALDLFDEIQTIGRIKLIVAIKRERDKEMGRCAGFWLQINIGREPQKSGALEEDLPQILQAWKDAGLPARGLMAIPPAGQNPEPYFKLMKGLHDAFQVPELSMGMSGDYERAIKHGATLVRLGSAIFGD